MQKNKITKLAMKLQCLKIKKASKDIRGEKFTELYMSFVDFLTNFLIGQANIYTSHVENNPQQYAKESGTKVITKYLEYVPDMIFSDGDMNTIVSFMIAGHILGQDETTIQISTQVSGVMEVDNTYASNYAKNRSLELSKTLNETTKEQVREIYGKAFTESWTKEETIEALMDNFGFSEYRAALIAHQETALAYEVGKAEQFGKYAYIGGVTGWKRSITQKDDSVRISHKQNEEEGWIPNDQLFSGTQTAYAPHGFNCRCVVVRSLIQPETIT